MTSPRDPKPTTAPSRPDVEMVFETLLASGDQQPKEK